MKDSTYRKDSSNSSSRKDFTDEKGTKMAYNKGKGNRKPNYRNNRGRKDKNEVGIDVTKIKNEKLSSLNDISWYARNPELLAASARIPTPYRPGMKVPYPGGHTGTVNWVYDGFHIPGVMGIYFNYSIGWSDNIVSPASLAAKEMFGRIRTAYSGELKADAPDIFMYALALDSVHSYIAYLKRIYRLLMAYDPNNRAIPHQVLKLMDFTDEHIRYMQSHKVELWGQINTLVHMVNKFSVPEDMSLYARHRWMNENVYTDNPGVASQMYVFIPNFFWRTREDTETGTALECAARPTTPDTLYSFGLDLIQKLSDWDDSYTINGYIERAYADVPYYKAELLGQDEVQDFAFVPEVLSQIQNSESAGAGSNVQSLGDYSGFEVAQDPSTNIIIHQPAVKKANSNNVGVDGTHLLNVPDMVGDATTVTIATRLKVSRSSLNTSYYRLDGGTEIVTHYGVIYKNPTTGDETISKYNSWLYSRAVTNGFNDSDVTSILDFLQLNSAFNFAPIVHVVLSGWNTGWTMCQWINPTSFSDAQLKEINRVCVYSEFNCFRSKP